MDTEAKKIYNGLRDVIDFELGLDVVALGLIRDVVVGEDTVEITMILTSPMCPMASFMMNQVRERAAELTDKAVEVRFGTQRWTKEMMEQDARDALGI